MQNKIVIKPTQTLSPLQALERSYAQLVKDYNELEIDTSGSIEQQIESAIDFLHKISIPISGSFEQQILHAVNATNKNFIKPDLIKNIEEKLKSLNAINTTSLSNIDKQKYILLRIKFYILAGKIFSYFEKIGVAQKNPPASPEHFHTAFNELKQHLISYKSLTNNIKDAIQKETEFFKVSYVFLYNILNKIIVLSPKTLNPAELGEKILGCYVKFYEEIKSYEKSANDILKLTFGHQILVTAFASKLNSPISFTGKDGWEGISDRFIKNFKEKKEKSSEEKLAFTELMLMNADLNRFYNKNSLLVKYKKKYIKDIDFEKISTEEINRHFNLNKEKTETYLKPCIELLATTDFKELRRDIDLGIQIHNFFWQCTNLIIDYEFFYSHCIEKSQSQEISWKAFKDISHDSIVAMRLELEKLLGLTEKLFNCYSKFNNMNFPMQNEVPIRSKQNMEKLKSRIDTIKKEFEIKTSIAKKNENELLEVVDKETKKREERKAKKNAGRNLTSVLANKHIDIDEKELNDLISSSEEEFEELNDLSLNLESPENKEQIFLESKEKELANLAQHVSNKISELNKYLSLKKEPGSAIMNLETRWRLLMALRDTITKYYKFFDGCQELFKRYEENKIVEIQEGISWSKTDFENNLTNFHKNINNIVQDFKIIYKNSLELKKDFIIKLGKEELIKKGVKIETCDPKNFETEGLKVYKSLGKNKMDESGFTQERRFFAHIGKDVCSLDWLNQRVKFFAPIKDSSNIITSKKEGKEKELISYSEYQIYLGTLFLLETFELKNEANLKFLLNYFETLAESFKFVKNTKYEGQANYYVGRVKNLLATQTKESSNEETLKYYETARDLLLKDGEANSMDLQIINEAIETLKNSETKICRNF